MRALIALAALIAPAAQAQVPPAYAPPVYVPGAAAMSQHQYQMDRHRYQMDQQRYQADLRRLRASQMAIEAQQRRQAIIAARAPEPAPPTLPTYALGDTPTPEEARQRDAIRATTTEIDAWLNRGPR